MRTLALASFLWLWPWLGACAGPGQRVDPHFAGDLDAVEQALVDNDDAKARELIDAIAARKPTGAAAQRTARLEGTLAEHELAPYGATFEALDGALRDHDQVVARHILERMKASGAPASVLEHAQAYERIVAGRELVAALDLRLDAQPAGEPGVYEVALVATHANPDSVRLRVPSGSLSFLATGVDPSGIEQRAAVNAIVDVLADVELAPHEPRRIALGTFSLAVNGLIASRGRWELSLNSGFIQAGGRELPAMHVAIEPCEAVRLDPRLPKAAVEPSELVRYVQAGAPSTPALLERAVRIENARRSQALDELAPVALALDDESLKRIVPALRWLGGERQIGGDPRAWRYWLQARVAALDAHKSGERLDSGPRNELAAGR